MKVRRALAVSACLSIASCANSTAPGVDSADRRTTTTVEATAAVDQLPTPVQTLDIDAGDYVFGITPDPVQPLRPGWTEVRLRNTGAEAHQIMFAQLRDGVDMAELAASGAGDSSGAGAIAFVNMLGGVSYIGPGNEITAMVNLPEGVVLAMCYVPDAKGMAHALMGMTTTLKVSASAPAPLPAAASGLTDSEVLGTIEMSADGYRFPESTGRGWYRVRNTDVDPADPSKGLHEMALLKLPRPLDDAEAEIVVQDLAANRTPDMALDAVGGLGATSAGFEGYLYLDLEPGAYLAVDFMPDPANPRPHMLDGYFATFSR